MTLTLVYLIDGLFTRNLQRIDGPLPAGKAVVTAQSVGNTEVPNVGWLELANGLASFEIPTNSRCVSAKESTALAYCGEERSQLSSLRHWQALNGII